MIITELLDELKSTASAKDFVESKNYYYDYHNCSSTGQNEKIMLDFTLKNDTTDKILRFGICKKCRLCCYHKDYEDKNF